MLGSVAYTEGKAVICHSERSEESRRGTRPRMSNNSSKKVLVRKSAVQKSGSFRVFASSSTTRFFADVALLLAQNDI